MAAPLPAAARRLIATVVISRLGAGLTLPYTLIFLHEVRGLRLRTALDDEQDGLGGSGLDAEREGRLQVVP